MIGKVDPATLSKRILGRTGAPDSAVIQGAAYGEDASAIDLGGTTLVVSADPISLAADTAGSLGVYVACNDVAASGADPRWLTNVLFLPDDDESTLDTITAQLDHTAKEIGVTIVGGHSEYHPDLSRPLLSLTCFGTTERFLPTGGTHPGDRILLTKGAAIEGTAILGSDFRDRMPDVPDDVIRRARSFVESIDVIPESRILREFAAAMHDPTEGGVLTGLVEMAQAAGVSLEIDGDAIQIRPETARLCSAMNVDPIRTFGSGALLAAVPAERVDAATKALAVADIDVATIGEARSTDDPAVTIDGQVHRSAVRDAMYPLWSAQDR